MTAKRRKSFIKRKKIAYIIVEGENMSEQEEKNGRITQITSGVLVGIANGLFGGGGGMLAVPLLQRTGLKEKQAHATAILVILPVSVFSFLLYFFRGLYDFSVLIPTAIGVAAGGFLGAAWLGKLPVKTVNIVFAILQAFAGAFLFFS